MNYAPYSYSKVQTHRKCPRKFMYAYRDKVVVAKIESTAMDRGTEIHKSVQRFMMNESDFLHPEIHGFYGQFFTNLRANYLCFPEHVFSFTEDWHACQYDDPLCWIRGSFDLKILPKENQEGELIVYEFKTGGIYEGEHEQQRLYYGIISLHQHPEFKYVRVITVYFDKQEIREVTYHREMLHEYYGIIRRDIKDIENEKYFPTKPQYGCRFCQFSRHNGGPCEF
jgi:CRISPR/Cas system-associated exonuclease Cas4 (RecB family)